MNKVLHPAQSRGSVNFGWLKANYSFSFSGWYEPSRMNFGVLRVLNDDFIDGGQGFPTHPHDNMEIITIPLEGGLAHKDSMGNGSVIEKYDIQVMSAGTGILHSEFNASDTEQANTLQIWLFPNKKNVQPRYDQMRFAPAERINKLQQVLSPDPDDEGVWIHQDAWFYLGNFDQGVSLNYHSKRNGNGVYLFLLSGNIDVEGELLNNRDAIGLFDLADEEISIKTLEKSEFLLMDVPMQI